MIPCLAGPEPLPSGAANECADDDHRDPENDEAEKKRPDREFALLPGVIAAAQRIGVYIRNHHQADDDHGRHDDAGNPRIEIDEHLLQAEEVPRRFGRIHRQVGIGGLFQWRIQRDRPDHQNDSDDDRGQKLDAQQERPDMDFFLPSGLEGPGLAMVCFGHRGIGFELLNQTDHWRAPASTRDKCRR